MAGGDVQARHNLGIFEAQAGNTNRAMKHLMVAANAGYDNSLKVIQMCFMNGDGTKDDFEKALRVHKDAKDDMKSVQRDAAAAYLQSIKNRPLQVCIVDSSSPAAQVGIVILVGGNKRYSSCLCKASQVLGYVSVDLICCSTMNNVIIKDGV